MSEIILTNRLHERDILGAAAMLMVVFNHAAAPFVGWKPNLYGLHSTELAAMSQLFVAIQMPLFVTISGLLYQSLSRQGRYQNIAEFLINKTKRLLVPYGMLAPLMLLFVAKNNSTCYELFKMFVSGVHHLWFVIMLFYAFVFFKIFWGPISNNKTLSFVVLAALSIAGFYLGVARNEMFGFANCLRFFLFFFLGMLLADSPSRQRLDNTWWLFAALYLFLRIPHMYFFRFDSFVLINSITPVAEGVAGCLALVGACGVFGERIMQWFGGAVNFLSRDLFGIYLFHYPIILWGIHLFKKSAPLNQYLVVSVLFLAGLGGGLAVTRLVRRIPRFKLAIGE